MKKTLIELMTATRADDVHIHIGWRRPSGLGRGRACLDVFILGPVRSALTCVAGWAAGWLAHGPRNQMQGRSRQGKRIPVSPCCTVSAYHTTALFTVTAAGVPGYQPIWSWRTGGLEGETAHRPPAAAVATSHAAATAGNGAPAIGQLCREVTMGNRQGKGTLIAGSRDVIARRNPEANKST